eukprot:SAG31_NODE_3740_length_3932_cov_3.662145_6_plen_95_part_00
MAQGDEYPPVYTQHLPEFGDAADGQRFLTPEHGPLFKEVLRSSYRGFEQKRAESLMPAFSACLQQLEDGGGKGCRYFLDFFSWEVCPEQESPTC